MAQVTGALAINNGATTPVAKSFAPERVGPELSTFVEKSFSQSAGFLRLAVGFSPASTARKTSRVDVSFDLPTMVDRGGGVYEQAYVGRFKGYFVIPDQMSSLERKDLRAFVANALNNTLVKGVVEDLDPMY